VEARLFLLSKEMSKKAPKLQLRRVCQIMFRDADRKFNEIVEQLRLANMRLERILAELEKIRRELENENKRHSSQ
jgi:exonuclease VII small subunit